jgi:hypothetical protein
MNFKAFAVIATLTLTTGFNLPISAANFNVKTAENHPISRLENAIAQTKTPGDSMKKTGDAMSKTENSMKKTGDSMKK